SDSVVIEVYPGLPAPEITMIGLDMATVDSEYTSYQWYYLNESLDSSIVLEEETLRIIVGPDIAVPWNWTGANVFVEVTDSNGCSPLSDTVMLVWEGIEETWLGHTSLQPNPFTNEFTLDYTLKDLANVRISIKDLAGKEIAVLLNEKTGAGSHTLAINTAQY